MLDNYLKRILNARIYDLAVETPLEAAPLISKRLNNNVLLKREDLQTMFSFKIRGAYNKVLQLSEAKIARGVIAASAGNHAQGLARSAKHLGIHATIVMPSTTPKIKVQAVRACGAKVVLHGDNFDAALLHSKFLMEKHNLTYIHPFDDGDVIAGQGTVAMEILRQHPKPIDAIFVPVGGGGLCAGIVAYVKSVRPKVKIIGVESEDSACLQTALKKNRRVVLNKVGIFADGVAVAQVGKEPFQILKDYIDDVITVSEDEICAAIKDIFEDTRSIAEPAGAISLAGLKKYIAGRRLEEKTLIAIDSGANINFDRLRYISERTEIGEKRENIFAITIPEELGAYKKLCKVIGKRNITEFNYRYSNEKAARIFLGVEFNGNENDRNLLVESLEEKNYEVMDLTTNELAKLHLRYMVGGRAENINNEMVFRFEFPERPGALYEFLSVLAGRWNISMFHYRNQGAAFGRVFVGLEVPKSEQKEVKELLMDLNYPFWDETNNQAYQFYLT